MTAFDESGDTPTSTYRPPTANHFSWSDEPRSREQTPEHWFEPLPAEPPTPVPPPRRRRSGLGGAVGLIVVAVLAAVLSSAGTFFVLSSGGWLKQDPGTAAAPTATPAPTAAATSPLVVTADDQVSRAATAVGPAVVTITTTTESTDPFAVPETGVGSGVIYDAAGWIVTNRHVVGTAQTVQVELPDGRKFTGNVYG